MAKNTPVLMVKPQGAKTRSVTEKLKHPPTEVCRLSQGDKSRLTASAPSERELLHF